MDTLKKNHNQNKLEKRLVKQTAKAITEYQMIEEGDVVMVCLSGGKDSYTLLDILLYLQKKAPITFSLIAVNLDQKQPDFPEHILPEYCEGKAIPYRVVQEDTYRIVKQKIPQGKTTCGLCSRLRRGILYRTAIELGANKIALGHHMDDMVETLFLNMFYGGRMKSMSPKLLSDDKKNIVIRPLSYCREQDIAQYAQMQNFPIIPCNLCGSQQNLQRQQIKEMLEQWEEKQPGRVVNIFHAMSRLTPSHLLDKNYFNFDTLHLRENINFADLDTAFDA